MELHKKFQQRNRYKQGNILLLGMGMTVLAGCLVLSYQNQVSFLRHDLRQNKKLQKEKQALNLAHFAFNKLKSIATDDFIATCEQNKKLHFYNVQTNESQDLGPIEFYSEEYKMGVEVLANEDFDSRTCFKFQESGVRQAIGDCFHEVPYLDKETIKQRWNNLQTKKDLDSPLFFPLVSELEIKLDKVVVTLYNPFDRSLKGQIYVNITGYTLTRGHGPGMSSGGSLIFKNPVNFDIGPRETYIQTISFPSGYTINKIEIGDLTFKGKLTRNYQVKYSELNVPFDYKLTLKSSGSRKPGPWSRRSSGTPATATESATVILPVFETGNWIQQLNACCFFGKTGMPYRTIDNFNMNNRGCIKLRDFFWNHTVADSEATAFNFNGSEYYLKNRFEAMNFFTSEANKQATIQTILSKQPYPNAVAFLKQMKEFDDKLYLFKHLAHRTECFNIRAFCENTLCIMTVCRKSKTLQDRTWKVLNIRLLTSEKH